MTTQRRHNSRNLLSDSITADCSRITAYERLSESMRLESAVNPGCFGSEIDSKNKTFMFLCKIFGIGKSSGSGSTSDDDKSQPEAAAAAPEKEHKRSKWLPDPDRRWPVQGW